MKRVFVVALCILILLSVTVCHADSDVSGTWYAYKYVKNGQEYDPADYKLYQVLALYPSGSNALIVREDGNHQEGTWAANDDSVTIMINYKSNIFRIEDGMLAQTVDGGTLWFTRDIDLSVPNDIRENSEEAYYGTWELYRVSNKGIILSMRMAELLGMNISGKIEVSKSSAYFEIDNGGKPVTWNGEPRYSSGKVYFGNAEITMTDTEELYLSSDTARYYFKKNKPTDTADGWICPSCGNTASGKFCNNCGQPYPGEEKTATSSSAKEESPKLYRGEYVIGTDLQPGVYILSANELEYDWMWEVNKASIRILDYIESEHDWVKNDYESVSKKGQKIKVTLSNGQKLKIESGSFEVASYQTEIDLDSLVNGKALYLGEYIIGTDLQPGAYTFSAIELEYDVLWETNKAAIRTYEYIKADRDWAKKDYESVNKKGQKIRITLEMGQKLDVEAGAFEIVDFEYRAPADRGEVVEEESEPENEPWFETGVGSKLPKPIAVSGKVLKASSLVTSNSEESFYTTVSASKKDYKKYISILREWGFNIDMDEVDTAFAATFSAKNSEGYKVSLTYTSFVGITVSALAPD